MYCFQFVCLMVKYLINLHVRLLHANLKPSDFQEFQLHRKKAHNVKNRFECLSCFTVGQQRQKPSKRNIVYELYYLLCTVYKCTMHIRLTFNFFFSQSPSKSHFFSFFPFLKILFNYFLLPTSLLIFQLSHNFSVHFVVDP